MKKRPFFLLLFSPQIAEGFRMLLSEDLWVVVYPAWRKSHRWELLEMWLDLRDRYSDPVRKRKLSRFRQGGDGLWSKKQPRKPSASPKPVK